IGDRQYVIVVRLDSPLEIKDRFYFVAPDGREYAMEKTPYISIRYEILDGDDFDYGIRSDREAMEVVALPENVEVPLYTITSEVIGSSPIIEDLRCTLKTRPKPKYEKQWQIIKDR